MSKPRKKTTLLAAITVTIFAAVVVGLVHAWLLGHFDVEEDDVRLRVCWDDEGRAVYVDEGAPCGPEALRWERQSLTVCSRSSDGGLAEVWQSRLTLRAVQEVRAQFGRQLLLPCPSSGAPDVWVIWDVPLERSGAVEYARHWRCEASDLACRSEVGVRATGDEAMAFRVLLHGLGHAMGLGHDGAPSSIMQPVQPDEPLSEAPARFVDAARDVLREGGL